MTRNANDRQRPPPDHSKELSKLFNTFPRHGAWQVFTDFNEAAAISLSNAVDLTRKNKREARYMQLIQRYNKDELDKFPTMLAHLIEALEEEPVDVLGQVFHDLELHNKWAGQFFTPYSIAQMMAKMTLADKASLEAIIARRGFVTASEPAAGSGSMVIALAMAMKDMGINYQQHLHVTAVDVDIKCVHMAFNQLALLHVPAIVIHGNSLSLEEHDHWFTPAHIMGGWTRKLKRAFGESGDGQHAIQTVTETPKPATNGPQNDSRDSGQPFQLTLF